MTTFNDQRLAWRDVPLADVLSPSGTRDSLILAGYTTLGKVLAASEDEIAARAAYVGKVRARKVRAAVIVAAHRITAASMGTFWEAPADEPFKPWRGEVIGSAIGVVGAVALIIAALTVPIFQGA